MICPHCGSNVPDGAAACRECGSDTETGWSEDADHFAGDIPTGYGPDDEFDYNKYTQKNSRTSRPHYERWIGLLILLYFAVQVFKRFL